MVTMTLHRYAVTGVAGETLQGTPLISTHYPSSPAARFSPQSFYFGCTLNLLNAAAAPPTECLISLAGYRGSDNTVAASSPVCSQQFYYLPSTALGPQQMAFSGPLLPCFQDIQFAVVQFDLPGGMSALDPALVLAVDDLACKLTTC